MTAETLEDLRVGLEAAAIAIEDAAYDLLLVSTQNNTEISPEIAAKIRTLHQHADRLKGYMEEVKVGRIIRVVQPAEA